MWILLQKMNWHKNLNVEFSYVWSKKAIVLKIIILKKTTYFLNFYHIRILL